MMTEKEWNDIRRDRLVKNELAFRDYNNRRVGFEQRIAVAQDVAEEEVVPFVCECGGADCIGAITVQVGEYEDAHRAPNRFTVRPGHFYPDVEQVVEEYDRYWVVEKPVEEMPPIRT
jgi:hypothetical protein